MGLSASQARLLSITQRINNNELQAEMLSNSRIQLSARNSAASEKYINALDATKLDYIAYNNAGSVENVALTFNAINMYSPLKNQYNLYNPEGQILVTQQDAKNFEDSASLFDFLDKYNLVDSRTIQVSNPEWQIEKDRYNEALREWQSEEPQREDYVTIVTGAPFWSHEDSDIYNAISNISCFSYTQSGQRCYMHVLSALLGFGTFTTSDGNTFEVKNVSDIGWAWNSCTTEEAAVMNGLRNDLRNDDVSDWVYDGDLETENHGTVPIKGDGTDAAKYNTATGGKCWQKCIDLLWELHFNYDGTSTGGTASEEELKKFWYFVEVDLGEGHMEYPTEEEFDENGYNNAYENWKNEKPIRADIPQTIEKTVYDKINDKAKGQWYINLFNAMDGRDKSNTVLTIYNENAEFDYWTVQEHEKVSTKDSENFVVLEEKLQSDRDWLQFALTNGLITMKQAALRLNGDITWGGIEFSSTSDIYESQDETKIAKAEAEYKQTLAQIQAEDKELEIKNKKLDTEHNALEKELESIKGVMDKNTERSFNTFS